MNVIYINTHDSGRMLSPYGYDIPTENLKKLAEDSVVFTNAFCAGPTCSPSRAALLTGTFPEEGEVRNTVPTAQSSSLHRARYL